MSSTKRTSRFTCAKCNGRQYTEGEVRTTGGFWSKIFNVQNRKFLTISCTKCGFTDFYNKEKGSTAENILDALTN